VSKEKFDETVEAVKKRGIEVIGFAQYKNGVRTAFLNPDQTGGIIFQLHDCQPEMEDFLDAMVMMV
jgi:hypothetical protein